MKLILSSYNQIVIKIGRYQEQSLKNKWLKFPNRMIYFRIWPLQREEVNKVLSNFALERNCHLQWHRLIKFLDGVLQHLVKIGPNSWTKPSLFRDGCKFLLITSQICSVGEKSGNLVGHGIVGQAWRQFTAARSVWSWTLTWWKVSSRCLKRKVTQSEVKCCRSTAILSVCEKWLPKGSSYQKR